MKWLLIITLFNADGSSTQFAYAQSTEESCERSAAYYAEFYESKGKKARIECEPRSPFVVKDND